MENKDQDKGEDNIEETEDESSKDNWTVIKTLQKNHHKEEEHRPIMNMKCKILHNSNITHFHYSCKHSNNTRTEDRSRGGDFKDLVIFTRK